jgi:hypothetical protein
VEEDEGPPADEPSARPGESRLFFEIDPPEAAVYIDGHFAGAAHDLNSMSEGFAIEPGDHHVTVTCPGYRERTITVNAESSRDGQVKLRLSR